MFACGDAVGEALVVTTTQVDYEYREAEYEYKYDKGGKPQPAKVFFFL